MGKYLDLVAEAAETCRPPITRYEVNEKNELNRITSFNSFSSYSFAPLRSLRSHRSPGHLRFSSSAARIMSQSSIGSWRSKTAAGS
jgi:hypothetical protein